MVADVRTLACRVSPRTSKLACLSPVKVGQNHDQANELDKMRTTRREVVESLKREVTARVARGLNSNITAVHVRRFELVALWQPIYSYRLRQSS